MAYTGRKRDLQSTPSVRRAEKIAAFFIGMGGFGTIVAVLLIFVFLISVVMPLFANAEIDSAGAPFEHGIAAQDDIVETASDEHQLMGYALARDGSIRTFSLADGEQLGQVTFIKDRGLASWSIPVKYEYGVFGLDDGTCVIAKIDFPTRYISENDVPEAFRDMAIGESRRYEDGVVYVTPERQWRLTKLRITTAGTFELGDAAIVQIDYSVTPGEDHVIASLHANGEAKLTTLQPDMLGDGFEVGEQRSMPTEFGDMGLPSHLLLDGTANSAWMIWKDGTTYRYDTRRSEPQVAEKQIDVTPDGAEVTTAGFMIGKTTILIGDSKGMTRGWFNVRPLEPDTEDGLRFRSAHEMPGSGAPVQSFGPSARSRMLTIGYENGDVRLFNATTGDQLGGIRMQDEGSVRSVRIAPKEDAILAFSATGAQRWNLDAGHPTATLKSLFGKVWYEGQREPGYTWQSTGGTDSFEPKKSIIPLIFGTIKATIYCMLIAAPLALLAALYTTEFLDPKHRAPVKSTIEMMASLPSVVLGFLAAITMAPFVQRVLPATMAALFLVPIMFLLGSRLWQLLPSRVALRWSGAPRIICIGLMFPLAIFLASHLGDFFENQFFEGDMKRWMAPGDPASREAQLAERQAAGDISDLEVAIAQENIADTRRFVNASAGGWKFILMPICALLVGFLMVRLLGPWVRGISMQWTRKQCAVFDFGRLVVWLGVSVLLAVVFGELLGAVGGDVRGDVTAAADTKNAFMHNYAQRNALLVGFVMGFAVVPIIYTLAEDALSAVPTALREGSLGAGATTWQTATRIVIPTATSGLFGALMVGLGRAVGETMIVLMAAGNTPIIDLNIFNGFRTLSANIAVELPEAPIGGTHYRVLFLTALVLFGMTFIINMGAEGIRRIFRRRFQDL